MTPGHGAPGDSARLRSFICDNAMTTVSKPLELRVARRFGEIINLIFAFVRQNFRLLIKSVVYIAGPPALVAGALVGGSYLQMFSSLSDPESLAGMAASATVPLVLGGILGLLTSILLVAIANNFVFLYMEHGPDGFSVRDVWDASRASFGRVFLLTLGLVLLFGALVVLAVLMMALNVYFGVLAGMAIFVVAVYAGVIILPVYTVRLQEDTGLMESISRCIELVKGHWWETVGVQLVNGLIANFIGGLFITPAYVIMIVVAVTSTSGDFGSSRFSGAAGVAITACMVVGMVASYLVSILPLLGNVFQYFNLVEKLEGVGLLAKIENIGSGEEPGGFSGTSL